MSGSTPAAAKVSPTMLGARTDLELRSILTEHRDKTVRMESPLLEAEWIIFLEVSSFRVEISARCNLKRSSGPETLRIELQMLC